MCMVTSVFTFTADGLGSEEGGGGDDHRGAGQGSLGSCERS